MPRRNVFGRLAPRAPAPQLAAIRGTDKRLGPSAPAAADEQPSQTAVIDGSSNLRGWTHPSCVSG